MKALNPHNQKYVDKFAFHHDTFMELAKGGQGYGNFATVVYGNALDAWRVLTEDERRHLEETVPGLQGCYVAEIKTYSGKTTVLDEGY